MKFSTLILTFLFLFIIYCPVYAESSYVLPYPSFMPGNKMYLLKEVVDDFNQYFYFGDFAQFKYHLNRSDKYLVEAKTLFEYKQYLLGVKALEKSDTYFKEAMDNLSQASKNNKDCKEKNNIFKSASLKHIEVLKNILSTSPETKIWNPEKGNKIVLNLKNTINHSVTLRNSCT